MAATTRRCLTKKRYTTQKKLPPPIFFKRKTLIKSHVVIFHAILLFKVSSAHSFLTLFSLLWHQRWPCLQERIFTREVVVVADRGRRRVLQPVLRAAPRALLAVRVRVLLHSCDDVVRRRRVVLILTSLDLGGGRMVHVPQQLAHLDLYGVEGLGGVQVLHVRGGDLEGVVRAEVLEVVVVRQRLRDLRLEEHGGLVGPAAGHVAQRVAPAAQHQHGHPERRHVPDTLGVAGDAQVPAADAVPRKAVRAALHHNGLGCVVGHDLVHHRPEDPAVGRVVHPLLQWHIDSVVLSWSISNILEVAGAREVVAELVERHGHAPVRGVEGLLHPIAMVDINVKV
mmetsp:Transcript_45766/g.79056  ORF Transcript_45766/g.79056 Transcript_45766/m.79056 type:complete len:339 (+) Transcript_45766:115-1131(+)